MNPTRTRQNPTRTRPEPAIGYVRVSTEEQARGGVSLDAQEERVRAYCAMAGLELVALLRDEGVSATRSLADRPEGARLLEAVAHGTVQHVVAAKLDRLFRDAVDCLQTAREWDRRGVALHLIDLGGQAVNTRSATGTFFLTVMAGAAEMEKNLIRERTASALAHKRSRGERLGTTPLGFVTPDAGAAMEPVDGELEAVRLILNHRRRGEPFRAIAARLRERGLPTKRGGEWHPATVRKIWEARDRYRGVLRA